MSLAFQKKKVNKAELTEIIRDIADHYTLTSVHGCKYLKQESPVINCRGEIIFHYTSTTYKEWCKA